ncbi:tripartite motif-containing protein 3 [Lingula anatina]|uniref:Tripartite motif-containing protein 3 n=1 Tax=Lingula anatina TaxID=7574 RepID=A0A1S3K5E3_LINAN|nr:tripartite motif-containing protein 3 [Lingula anatina]|eukprot:XP_013417732.1 tripartite motif-containing protein 3 [Lingula anatina]
MASSATCSDHSNTCPVCLDHYDLTKRVPKFLSCHHTVCLMCVQQLKGLYKLSCPVCRESTCLPMGGPEKLQTNFYLKVDNEEGCLKHKNQPYLFYCATHKALACQACTILDHKESKQCELQDLEPALKATKMILREKLSVLQTKKGHQSGILTDVNKKMEFLNASKQSAERAIDTTFHQYLSVIRKYQQTTKENLQQSFTQKHKTLSKKARAAEALIDEFETQISEIEDALRKNCISTAVAVEAGLRDDTDASKTGSLLPKRASNESWLCFKTTSQTSLSQLETFLQSAGQIHYIPLPKVVFTEKPENVQKSDKPPSISFKITHGTSDVEIDYSHLLQVYIKKPSGKRLKAKKLSCLGNGDYRALFPRDLLYEGTYSAEVTLADERLEDGLVTFSVK